MKDKIINTIIVDDQQASIDVLRNDLMSLKDIQVIDTCTSAFKAREAIFSHQPSLLFLDVEMPKVTGLELLQRIQERIFWPMCVVFYSAFDKYMLDALRVSAADYLLKPYLFSELQSVVDRVKKKLLKGEFDLEKSIRILIDNGKKIALNTVSGLSLLEKNDILYFEHCSDCWTAILTNMTHHRLKVNTSSKDISGISPMFVQVHQNYIININYLSSIENKTLRCVFLPPFNHLEIFVSRRNYVKLKNTLNVL